MLGIILGFCSVFCCAVGTLVKNKEKAFWFFTVQSVFATLSLWILGGFGGSLVSILALFRNFLTAKDRLNDKWTSVFAACGILSWFISYFIMKEGLISILPCAAFLLCTVFCCRKCVREVRMHIWMALIAILWIIYSAVIRTPEILEDLLTLILSIMWLFKYGKEMWTMETKAATD